MDSTAPQSSSAVLEDRPPYPQDIIAVIVSHVGDRETLLTLCLTNRVVGHEARIMIYRNLHVISHGHQSPEMHLKRLLESLTSNPDLPPLVQSFTMLDDITRSPQHTEETLNELIAMDTDPTSKRERVEQLLSILLSKVLPRMVNLQELAAYGSRIRASGLAPALLGVPSGPGDGGGSRAFFQLQKLVWDNCWDASFIDFIKTQTDLKVLSLGSSWCHWYSIVNYRIPQDICDGLTCILGDQRVIQAILPFAPGVRSAVLKFAVYRDERRFGPNVDMSAKGQLARAMSQLTMLSFHNFGCAELAHISILGTQALSSLRVLVVARLPETDVSVSVKSYLSVSATTNEQLHAFKSQTWTLFHNVRISSSSSCFPGVLNLGIWCLCAVLQPG